MVSKKTKKVGGDWGQEKQKWCKKVNNDITLIGLVVNNIYLIMIKSRAYGCNSYIESVKPRLGEYIKGI